MIAVKVIEDSVNATGNRLTTLQLVYPRFIHAELMTHRVFSRNASSSRAIPVKKMLEMVRNEPARPIHWGKNQPGMQANEQLTGDLLFKAQELWHDAAVRAAEIAERMMDIGLHKQVANRILEPFQHINVVLTATEFDNWDELRDHDDADPNIHELARQIKAARNASKPTLLEYGQWHLPYITADDREAARLHVLGSGEKSIDADELREAVNELLCRISAARCCRVSYLKHDGAVASIVEDLALCDRLAAARPIHASPFEHQATPMPEAMPHVIFYGGGDVEVKGYVPEGVSHIDVDGRAWSGNFKGWIQSRKLIEASFAS